MRREIPAMLSLAWPVVLAELGWVFMGLVDTIAVGPLGPAAIGAVGTGSTIFFAFMVLGIGTLFALDTFVSQNYGGGRIDECHRWLFAGLWLSLVLSAGLLIVGYFAVDLLPVLGIHAEVVVILQPYLRALLWSAPALLVYTVLRRYLQAMNLVRPVLVAIVIANVVNAIANWVLIYGMFGVPALGAVGAAYATLASRLFLAAALWLVVVRHERRYPSGLHDVSFAPDAARMWRLTRLGIPAALQIMLEVGVFAAAAVLAGRISPVALAANQIVLNIAGLFFMVPYGLSSAAAVRVGQAVGRGDIPAARLAGWSAIALSLTAAAVIAVLFLLAPRLLLIGFTRDPALLATGATLLLICAVFQPFDGLQTVATGALRGLGDTTTPMVFNLAGHWLIGLPVAYVLCFRWQWGVTGLWTGLSVGVILIGIALVSTWYFRSLHTRQILVRGV